MINAFVWGGLADLLLLTLVAASNMALRLPSRARLAEEFERAGKAAQLERLLEKRSQLMLATGTVRSAASLGLVLFILALLEVSTTWDESARFAGAFLGAWVLTLVFGIAIPTAWAKYAGEHLLLRAYPWLLLMNMLLFPLIWLLGSLDPFVRRLAGVPDGDPENAAEHVEKEILNAVSEGERQGAVDELEKEMIESIIELRDTEVHEIMTPRTEIIAIPEDAGLQLVRDLIREHGHSRIPVYQGTIDRILGVLYAKDLLYLDPERPFDAKELMRPVPFIPEAKRVRELLAEIQQRKVHIAVILDEYGGTAGLVTIEDILEELVGEIADEYEAAEPEPLLRLDDHTIEVDGRMSIDDLNYELGIALPEHENYETIGGFIFSTLGRIPEVGEVCESGNVGIEVIGAEPRRVTRVRLTIRSEVGVPSGNPP